MIDRFRVTEAPEMKRVVIGVDPSGSGAKTADEAGLIVVGLGVDGHGYVLDDTSGIMSPNQWGTQAIRLYYKWEADRIIAEVNQGWEMVSTIIRNIDRDVPIASVHASRGKVVRAEPVVALYERGMVHHVGVLMRLEDEMTTWDSRESNISPGRIDALVWGLSELMCKKQGQFVLV
jgi:phage terminase large subunit-like protein